MGNLCFIAQEISKILPLGQRFYEAQCNDPPPLKVFSEKIEMVQSIRNGANQFGFQVFGQGTSRGCLSEGVVNKQDSRSIFYPFVAEVVSFVIALFCYQFRMYKRRYPLSNQAEHLSSIDSPT